RPIQEPAASSVANYLVPLQVANSKTNQAWRYAPYARLALPIIDPCPSARIQLWFSVPTWISYAEQGREHPIRRATLRDTKPSPAFFQIESAETWEDAGLARSLLEDDGEHVKVRSY